LNLQLAVDDVRRACGLEHTTTFCLVPSNPAPSQRRTIKAPTPAGSGRCFPRDRAPRGGHIIRPHVVDQQRDDGHDVVAKMPQLRLFDFSCDPKSSSHGDSIETKSAVQSNDST
jgi:hypothetical protein